MKPEVSQNSRQSGVREFAGNSLCISEAQLLELVRSAIQKEVSDRRPLIREEILKSMQLVNEEGGIAMLPIQGKDPRRTFRRLMNKHGVEYVKIDGFKWFKRSAIAALIEKHTVRNRGSSNLRVAA